MGNTFVAVAVNNLSNSNVTVIAETPGTTIIVSTVKLALRQNDNLSLANGSSYTLVAINSKGMSAPATIVLNGPSQSVVVTTGANGLPVIALN